MWNPRSGGSTRWSRTRTSFRSIHPSIYIMHSTGDASCTYIPLTFDPPPSSMAAAVQRVPLPLRRRGNNPGTPRDVCRYWRSGHCDRNPCRFLHADPPPPPPVGAAKKRSNTWHNPSSKPSPTTTSAAVPPAPPTKRHGEHDEKAPPTKRHAEQDEQAPQLPPPKRGCRAQEEEEPAGGASWCAGDGVHGVARLAGHAKVVTGVAMPAGSGTLYSGSLDGTVRAWGCATGQCVGVTPVHDGEVGRLTAMGPWVLAGVRGAVMALHTKAACRSARNGCSWGDFCGGRREQSLMEVSSSGRRELIFLLWRRVGKEDRDKESDGSGARMGSVRDLDRCAFSDPPGPLP